MSVSSLLRGSSSSRSGTNTPLLAPCFYPLLFPLYPIFVSYSLSFVFLRQVNLCVENLFLGVLKLIQISLQKNGIWFLAPMWWFIISCNSSCRDSNVLSDLCELIHASDAHTHTHTHIHLGTHKIFFKNIFKDLFYYVHESLACKYVCEPQA